MEIEEKLESIDSKIDSYNTQIENLSSLITTLIHSFQQNQLPSMKAEILEKIEEKFQDTTSFPDVDEMKKVLKQIRTDFTKNQNGLSAKVIELDTVIAKLSSTVENVSVSNESSIDSSTQTQLNNIESILNSLTNEISDFKDTVMQNNVSDGTFPTEKIDTINSLLAAQNVANNDFLHTIENYFKTLEENIENLKENQNIQPASSTSTEIPVNTNISISSDIVDIKNRFNDLNLAITSVLSAIKIIDKKYTELKSFQDVIDKLTTDVVSPILVASNDVKAFVDKSSKNFEKLNQFVEEYDKGTLLAIQSQISDVNIDVNKILGLVEEFKTNSDLSNHTISDNMAKLENLLTTYNENLTELTQTATADAIKDGVKSLNDSFYIDLLNLFNSLSFDTEAEDIKDFLENILVSITAKTDENSEKLNNIMLQFKSLLNKVEGIERAQNSISDYLKPEETDEILYSFDDIQSDLAKMRLVLNEISTSINSSEVVDEISAKIRTTSEQLENVSKMLTANPENSEAVSDLKEKIETLNEQVYDISVRTNKLLLSNEDSTLELKNNLEIFKDVFEKANPEKLYELFYELTNYFNDVNDKILSLTLTTQNALNETVTIKNALIYVGEWLDKATTVLAEIKDNTEAGTNNNTSAQAPSSVVIDTSHIEENILNVLNKNLETTNANILNTIKTIEDNINNRLNTIENSIQQKDEAMQKYFVIIDTNMQKRHAETLAYLSEINGKIDSILNAKVEQPANVSIEPEIEPEMVEDDIPAEFEPETEQEPQTETSEIIEEEEIVDVPQEDTPEE